MLVLGRQQINKNCGHFPKHGLEQEKVNYLTNLAKIGRYQLGNVCLNGLFYATLGSKAGSELLTHYSLGWHWFEAGDVTFNGVNKNVVKHMIDMFNSTDIQTAYVLGDVMLERLQKGFDGTAAVS